MPKLTMFSVYFNIGNEVMRQSNILYRSAVLFLGGNRSPFFFALTSTSAAPVERILKV